MTNNIKEILVGLVLGDGHINRSGDKSFLTIEQSTKHSAYVLHLEEMFKKESLLTNPVKYYSRSDRRYDSINESIYLKTHNLESLNFLSDMFIKDDRKIIPLDIKEWLTPISLAHWICGDGQLVKGGGITLCTDNYTLEEVNYLISCLKEKFNVECTIHNKKSRSSNVYYRIYIKKKGFEELKPSIMEHVHKTFLYKLHQ